MGGREKIRGTKFQNDLFLVKNIPNLMPKIFDDIFLLSEIWYIWPFSDEKNSFLDERSLHFRTKNSLITPLFTQFVLSHASSRPNTTSRNIGGTDTWAVPHLKFWEGPSPISFPPWLLHIANQFNDTHNSGDNETWRLYCEKP